jgi:hypothetical protein
MPGGFNQNKVESELGLQATEQLGVNTRIDFALEDLLGTLDRQRRHFFSQ